MNYKTIKMPNHEYSNCLVRIYDNGCVALQSYSTMVAYYNQGYLLITGLYSATTRKHIGWFMNNFTPYTYQDAKRIYNTYTDVIYGVSVENGDIVPNERQLDFFEK